MKTLYFFLISSFLISSSSYALFNSNENKFLLESEKRKIKVYENVVPSVVNITNLAKVPVGGIFSRSVEEMQTGMGTGFVWDGQGHIVTNYHVVADKRSKYYVSFYNHKDKIEATLVGHAEKLDIAVLKVKFLPPGITPINPGTSNNLKVGQMAIAIGNPFELDYSMSVGIISALGRKIKGVGGVDIHGMIQTDASINPGNSGGPLLNSQGKLIGMNTLIYSRSGSSSGLGFSVPVDSITRSVPDIIKYGKMITPALGVFLLEDHLIRYFKQYYKDLDNGVMIKGIRKGSGADEAGLVGIRQTKAGEVFMGDLIMSIDGNSVKNMNDIYHVLKKKKIGDRVKVKVKKYDGKIKIIKVRLEPL